MSPSRVADPAERGWIIPIGGAEEKEDDTRILERFVSLCGGCEADIVVIPTASRVVDIGEQYEQIFAGLGAGRVESMDFDTRRDADEPRRLERLQQASGIFLTGGNQLRLSTILGGTGMAQALRAANARGVHVGGTSAGASILSDHMMAFGSGGSSPSADSVHLAPGLGLTNRVIIDQHFRQRDRLGRLLAALAYNPFPVGLGLDEDTAAFIGPDDTIEVVGSGGVTVVDAGDLQFSSMDQARKSDIVCLLGLKLHILVEGATFNLRSRQAAAGSLVPDKITA